MMMLSARYLIWGIFLSLSHSPSEDSKKFTLERSSYDETYAEIIFLFIYHLMLYFPGMPWDSVHIHGADATGQGRHFGLKGN